MDEESLTQIAQRNRNLVRAVNIRRGMRREDEKPPADHWKRRFPELEEKLLDDVLQVQGLEQRGHPDRASPCRSWAWTTWARTSSSGGS